MNSADLPHPGGDAGETLAGGTAKFSDSSQPGGTTFLFRSAVEKPGDQIGRYKLVSTLGEGGCGAVFLAEQSELVRRKVAFKVNKLGMDTRSVVARFEAERQALALMDHPHIAKVLDAGATAGGRPFFVMELVSGVPITEFCDAHGFNTRRRKWRASSICGNSEGEVGLHCMIAPAQREFAPLGLHSLMAYYLPDTSP